MFRPLGLLGAGLLCVEDVDREGTAAGGGGTAWEPRASAGDTMRQEMIGRRPGPGEQRGPSTHEMTRLLSKDTQNWVLSTQKTKHQNTKPVVSGNLCFSVKVVRLVMGR